MIDYITKNIADLNEELKLKKEELASAEEQLLGDLGEDWDYLKINGRVVYTRTSKPGQNRFDVQAFRKAHPDLAKEFTGQGETKSKVDRVKD